MEMQDTALGPFGGLRPINEHGEGAACHLSSLRVAYNQLIAETIYKELASGKLDDKACAALRDYKYHMDCSLAPLIEQLQFASLDDRTSAGYVIATMKALVFCGQMTGVKKKDLIKELKGQQAALGSAANAAAAAACENVLDPAIITVAGGLINTLAASLDYAAGIQPGVRAHLEEFVKHAPEEEWPELRKKMERPTYPSPGTIRDAIKRIKTSKKVSSSGINLA
jgi:hypothetical protein